MTFLRKLQSLPEKKKNAVLWLIVATLGSLLLVAWLSGFWSALKDFSLQEEIDAFKMPEFEKPQILDSSEEFKQIKQNLEQNAKQ